MIRVVQLLYEDTLEAVVSANNIAIGFVTSVISAARLGALTPAFADRICKKRFIQHYTNNYCTTPASFLQ